MDTKTGEMTIESLNKKVENQATLIKELTNENEVLYHQYNHLIIRNGKMLQRIDDFQKIIDDLHIRIEELQLINSNMMMLNDKLRRRMGSASLADIPQMNADSILKTENVESDFNMEELQMRWKNYPGQESQNGPNLHKQVVMLIHLYGKQALSAGELFTLIGIGGVTGARYVSLLKKHGLVCYKGARKKGKYEITRKGIEFMEPSLKNTPRHTAPAEKQRELI